MNYLLQRLSEPSTYAGIAAVLAAAGYAVPPGTLHAVMFCGVAASGLVAVFVKEGWHALEDGDFIQPLESAATIVGAAGVQK